MTPAAVAVLVAFPLAVPAQAGRGGLPAGVVPLARITVNVDRPGALIPPDFDGLSIEYPAVDAYLGETLASPNAVFRRLLTNLGRGSLRIGGDSQDTSCWHPGGGPVGRGCAFTFGRSLPRVIFATAAATRWRALVGINLALNRPSMALSYVKEGILPVAAPGNLLGLEIGNEPDLYRTHGLRPASYSLERYMREFDGYVAAFRGDAATAALPLVGPAFITRDWDQDVGRFVAGVGARNLSFLTLHYYPFSACSAPSAARATDAALLDRGAITSLYRRFSRYVAVARSYGLTVRMGETNSVSCHGKAGVSDSFASALWGLDVLFTLARAGLSGVNFHIYDRDRSPGYYNPVVSMATRTATGTWTYRTTVRPLYYAMLLFRNAVNLRFLPTTVASGRAGVNITAYAAGGGATVQVFVLNQDRTASGTAVIVPSHARGPATVTYLRAPALSATMGTTLGGQAADPETGRLGRPRTRTIIPDRATGAYLIPLPTASAAMVTLRSR